MPRQRFQRPTVKKSAGKIKQWGGSWYCYTRDPVTGKEKRKHKRDKFGFVGKTTKADAQAALDRRVAAETRGPAKPDAEMTLGRFLDEVYIPLRSARWKSVNTRLSYQGAIKNHIQPQLGNVPLKELNKLTIQRHLMELSENDCGLHTLRMVKMIISAALEEAVENDFIAKNPARKVELPPCKAGGACRALSIEEVKTLFSSTTGQDRLIWRMLVLTGMRIGELCPLRRVDIGDGQILVRRGLVRGKVGRTKNRRDRVAPLPPGLAAELEQWMEMMPDQSPDALLFSTSYGTMLDQNNVGHLIMERARLATGIADLTFHMCRRTFCTHYSGDVKDAGEIVGHGGTEITMKYYKRHVPERQRVSVEALERLFTEERGRVN